MSDAFISYSRSNQLFADRIVAELEKNHQSAWIDHSNIEFNVAWWDEIKRGIETSDSFVLIMSPDSLSSPICHLEIEYAQKLTKNIVTIYHIAHDQKTSKERFGKRLYEDDMDGFLLKLYGDHNPMQVFQLNWDILPAKQRVDAQNIITTDEKGNAINIDENLFIQFFQKLRKALDTDIQHIHQHTLFYARAQRWVLGNKSTSFLLNSTETIEAENWLSDWENDRQQRAFKQLPPKNPQPDDILREFITESRLAENILIAQRAKDEEQTRNLQRQRQRFFQAAFLAGIVGFFAIVAAILATTQAMNANNQIATATVAQATLVQAAALAQTQAATAIVAQGVAIDAQETAVANAMAATQEQGKAQNAAMTAIFAQGTAVANAMVATQEQGKAQNAAIFATIAQGEALNAEGTAVAQADAAKKRENVAKTEIAIAEAELTSVPPTLTAVALQVAEAQQIGFQTSIQILEAMSEDSSEKSQMILIMVKSYPSADAYLKRAKNYDNPYKALLDLTVAIEIKPDEPDAYFQRGNVNIDLNRYNEAVDDFSKVIELNPKFPDGYYWRGISRHYLEQYEEAVEDYSKAIELNQKFGDAYYSRGIAYRYLEQYDKAIDDYSKAIELNSQDADAYYSRAIAYHYLEQYDKAIDDYSKAIKLNSQNADVFLGRGNAYYDLEQYEEAIDDYTQVIQLNPKDRNAYYYRGISYSALEQYEEAIDDYTQVIQLNPKDRDAYLNRGMAYYWLYKVDVAISDLSKSVELDPKYVDAYLIRGIVYYLGKRYKEAVTDWEKVETLGGTLPPEVEKALADAKDEFGLTPIPKATDTIMK